METEAIYRMVTEAGSQGYHCAVIISDDNSTMKSNLRHSYKQKLDAGIINASEWPRTNSGAKKKKDNGRLPLEIVEPKFLADFNHRVKTSVIEVS